MLSDLIVFVMLTILEWTEFTERPRACLRSSIDEDNDDDDVL